MKKKLFNPVQNKASCDLVENFLEPMKKKNIYI